MQLHALHEGYASHRRASVAAGVGSESYSNSNSVSESPHPQFVALTCLHAAASHIATGLWTVIVKRDLQPAGICVI